jgi:hypothetical protein
MVEDSRSWLTKWLTKNDENIESKTRVNTREQIEWTFAQKFNGDPRGLDIPHCALMADLDMRLMVSFKGLSREEAVEAMKSMDLKTAQQVGLPPLKAYKDAQAKE